jgi:hypothetical protein
VRPLIVRQSCRIWEKLFYNRQIMKDLNRLKIVLVEQKRTGKWLAEQLGKDTSTVSKWCSNKIQPSLEVLTQIANVLEIDVRQLINSNITTSN